MVDLDSTLCQTYGLGKQGGLKVNRDGARGYHPLVAIIDGYDQVAATRLRMAEPTTPAAPRAL